MVNDNNLGIGRAERLWNALDTEKKYPEIFQMFCDIPGDTVGHILSACEKFDNDFARAIVLQFANDESFTREGRNHDEIGATILLAAVVAPVVAEFPMTENIVNPDGSVPSRIANNIYRCKSDLERYWLTDIQSFSLHEKNRAYFVQGWILLTGTEIGTVLLDAELDQHLMWVGSRFDDLKPYIKEILKSGKFDSKPYLTEVADRSLDKSLTTLADGSPNQQWYADNGERLNGYCKEGHYSVLPDSRTEEFFAKYGDMTITILGVPVRSHEFVYLEAKAALPLDEAPYMKVLSALFDGIELESPFAGKAALLLSTFSEAALFALGYLASSYDLEVRSMLAKILLDYAALRKPLNVPNEDESFVSTVFAIAPVFKAFFDVTYKEEELVPEDGWTSLEWAMELTERRDDAIWDSINDCYRYINNLLMLEEAVQNDFGLMVMFLRATAVTHFIDLDNTDVQIDVMLVNERIDDICRNAGALVNARSLSEETIKNLPKG